MRIVLFAVLAAIGAIAVAAQQPTSVPAPPLPFDLALDRSTRLLVVAPHPDDEALGAAGLIQRVLERGGQVRVVLLTSGDGFPEGVEVAEGVAHPTARDFQGYGAVREAETLTAMGIVGVSRPDVRFLGFPDEGLCQIASTYLFDKRRAFESPYTSRESPPSTEQNRSGREVSRRRRSARARTARGAIHADADRAPASRG
ncbi:MAG: PIG-L family deacetylase [Vicinamibacterales bacterium]